MLLDNGRSIIGLTWQGAVKGGGKTKAAIVSRGRVYQWTISFKHFRDSKQGRESCKRSLIGSSFEGITSNQPLKLSLEVLKGLINVAGALLHS